MDTKEQVDEARVVDWGELWGRIEWVKSMAADHRQLGKYRQADDGLRQELEILIARLERERAELQGLRQLAESRVARPGHMT